MDCHLCRTLAPRTGLQWRHREPRYLSARPTAHLGIRLDWRWDLRSSMWSRRDSPPLDWLAVVEQSTLCPDRRILFLIRALLALHRASDDAFDARCNNDNKKLRLLCDSSIGDLLERDRGFCRSDGKARKICDTASIQDFVAAPDSQPILCSEHI